MVNIKNIKELGGIRKTGTGLRIGALVTMDELARNADVRAGYQSLADAAAGIPSPQIRHMGTVGGDLCQRPRCWYYRQGFGLLAMKDGKSLVPDGENQYHAIFGGGPAYFVSASSLGPALVALGAKVKLVSAKGSREMPAEKFFVAPKDENDARDRAAAERDPHRNHGARRRRRTARPTKCGRRKRSIGRWPPLRWRFKMNGATVASGAGSCWVTWRPRRGKPAAGKGWRARPSPRHRRGRRQSRGRGRAAAQPERLQGATGQGRGQAGAADAAKVRA